MLLRDHPLMSHHGVANWPPTWTWIEGRENTHPKGEIGILKEVILSTVPSCKACFLIMEHCETEYVGVLLLSDPAFYREIYRVLVQSCGETIRDIGDIDLSYML